MLGVAPVWDLGCRLSSLVFLVELESLLFSQWREDEDVGGHEVALVLLTLLYFKVTIFDRISE